MADKAVGESQQKPRNDTVYNFTNGYGALMFWVSLGTFFVYVIGFASGSWSVIGNICTGFGRQIEFNINIQVKQKLIIKYCVCKFNLKPICRICKFHIIY